MAGLCWMTVTLALLLSAGSSQAVDQNTLARVVKEILNRYEPSYLDNKGTRHGPMFSVAVSVPYNKQKNTYDMTQVPDDGEVVRETILRCRVYTSSRVVAATVLRWPNVLKQCPNEPVPWDEVLKAYGRTSMRWADITEPYQLRDGQADHAEYRTLTGFDTLLRNHDKNDLLIFYVLSSPCDQRCTSKTNRLSILKRIKQILKWNEHAVVFSNIFQPRSGPRIPEKTLEGALRRLGESVGLENIFRCNKEEMLCTSCSSGSTVTPYCYSENSKPPVVQPQPGTSHSPPRRINSPQPGPSTIINTGQDEEGSGGGTGGKRKRKRRRGKKKQSTKPDDNVPSSQNDLENRDTNAESNAGGGQNRPPRGKVLKVGGRRVNRKQRGGGNDQKKKKKKKPQTNKRKKHRGAPQGRQKGQGWATGQRGEGQMGREPQNRKKMWMNGETRRVDQPKRGNRKRRRG